MVNNAALLYDERGTGLDMSAGGEDIVDKNDRVFPLCSKSRKRPSADSF